MDMTKAEFPYVNEVRIAGRVVRDPELRRTGAGVPVANFKLACGKVFIDEEGARREETCYVGVAAWQDLAQRCKDRLQQGATVLVEGELKSRLRDNGKGVKRSFVEIRASDVKVLLESGELTAVADAPMPIEATQTEMSNKETMATAVAGRPATVTMSYAAADQQYEALYDSNAAEHEEL
jgi:single-strand DNA-binding protein